MSSVRTLVVDGVNRGSCEIARTFSSRRRGLLGRSVLDGSLLLEPCRNVHTIGMKFAIDVAYLKPTEAPDQYLVIRTRMMTPGRLDRPVMRSRAVLESRAGAFNSWGLVVGSKVLATA